MPEGYLTWVEIEKDAIKHNLAVFQKVVGPHVKLMPIVKSNAYGHGMVGIAEIASDFGVDYLGVVNLAEALELRKNHILTPILVLSYFDLGSIEEALENNIELTVYDRETVRKISEEAKKLNKRARLHVKIDTGTARLGILAKEAAEFIDDIKDIKGIELVGIFTHFADSENADWTYTNQQILEFKNLLFHLQKRNITIPLMHAACSAAALVSADTHFNLVRVGISLYGLWPSEETKQKVSSKYSWLELKPALTWKTKIVQIKELEKRSPVGYGCSYKTSKKTRLAIIPVGYHEGYSRLLSNKGEALINGKIVPVIGRVCMNLTMIDVTKVRDIKVGEEVILIGKKNGQEITAEEIAKKTNTINYEVITRINPLIPRVYL
ncbi:MAG: alanine racemase [Candidatus Kerfeldbacteria bacterium CG08_land_8_20_14_0_20_40_16]|uniref:Alanine racemase n=1 Tax=Candidatus Kerfeldbacteria bacterium CG08_land_8_20_14_0_20_40_16 TaxID=2014244 RepID=A0A2H0YUG4_9BACT|nr:MAG: alanine racemase [Candidatus Kerfeldbacteria bacterium CG08_land_8_20_14_0_20_40_16]